jgi:hypothetical protein
MNIISLKANQVCYFNLLPPIYQSGSLRTSEVKATPVTFNGGNWNLEQIDLE